MQRYNHADIPYLSDGLIHEFLKSGDLVLEGIGFA
jgi:hypothetical protein